jgi:2-keto-4-pentenoate hydratase/2-oxohepta-3-ene-1,7-dioic acid hydratase in catechol pathway
MFRLPQVSARDLQFKSNKGQWLLGKTGDGHAPIGPAIVTSDDVPAPVHLDIKCSVNGIERQSSNTSQLVRVKDLLVEG